MSGAPSGADHPALTSHRLARVTARGARRRSTPGSLDPRDPLSLVKDCSAIASPPDVCLRVFELMRSSRSTARDFGAVISSDPNLSARLLRIVNSPFYGFARRIDTLPHAVTAVGLGELYSLVVAVSALQRFAAIPGALVDMDRFWRHSLHCALLCRGLARRLHLPSPERVFLAGLLHDIGCLLLFDRLPETCAALLERAAGDERALHAYETEALGYDHALVGALLLRQWQIPETLVSAVGGHHEAPAWLDAPADAEVVRLAELLSSRDRRYALLHRSGDDASAACRGIELPLDGVDLQALLEEVDGEIAQTTRILTG